ncbi:MAG: tetratricopeptide repeat protein, partial [Trueperaceae bacterium]
AHARTYLALVRRWEEPLTGGPQQERAIEAIGLDLPNVRSAVRTAAERGDLRALWTSCRPLQLYFIQRGGRWDDAIETFAEAAERVEAWASPREGAPDDRVEVGVTDTPHPDADVGHAVLGRLRAAQAWFHYREGQVDEAKRWAEDALARIAPRAQAHPDDPVLVRALASVRNTLANVAQKQGDLREAARRFEEVRRDALERCQERQVAIVANNLGSVRKSAGDLAGAEAAYREALRINRSRGNRRSEVRNLINLGTGLLLAGDVPSAEESLRDGLRLARAIGFRSLEPTLLTTLGSVALVASRPDAAEALHREALELVRATPDPDIEADVRIGLAELALARGRPASARTDARRALRAARRTNDPDTLVQALLALARSYLAEDRCEQAAYVLGATRVHPPRSRYLHERAAAVREIVSRVLGEVASEEHLASGAHGPIDDLMEPDASPEARSEANERTP